jgi:hypothetical protein
MPTYLPPPPGTQPPITNPASGAKPPPMQAMPFRLPPLPAKIVLNPVKNSPIAARSHTVVSNSTRLVHSGPSVTQAAATTRAGGASSSSSTSSPSSLANSRRGGHRASAGELAQASSSSTTGSSSPPFYSPPISRPPNRPPPQPHRLGFSHSSPALADNTPSSISCSAPPASIGLSEASAAYDQTSYEYPHEGTYGEETDELSWPGEYPAEDFDPNQSGQSNNQHHSRHPPPQVPFLRAMSESTGNLIIQALQRTAACEEPYSKPLPLLPHSLLHQGDSSGGDYSGASAEATAGSSTLEAFTSGSNRRARISQERRAEAYRMLLSLPKSPSSVRLFKEQMTRNLRDQMEGEAENGGQLEVEISQPGADIASSNGFGRPKRKPNNVIRPLEEFDEEVVRKGQVIIRRWLAQKKSFYYIGMLLFQKL